MPDQVGHDECVIAGLTGNLNENNLKTDIMIKVSNLSKIFRTEEIETTALNGVSFEIKDGEFVASLVEIFAVYPYKFLFFYATLYL